MADLVNIADGRQLYAWLKDKPSEWANAIGRRVTLRVLPLIFGVFDSDKQISQANKEEFVLHICRMVFIAWAESTYSDHKKIAHLEGALYAAEIPSFFPGSSEERLSPATVAAIYVGASAAAFVPDDDAASVQRFASDASDFAAYAADAAYLADVADAKTAPSTISSRGLFAQNPIAPGKGAIAIWESVTADARWQMEHERERLIEQPLWLIDVRGDRHYQSNFPPWVRTPFDDFDKSELVRRGAWGVWLAWYRGILPNSGSEKPHSVFGIEVDVEIATQDPQFWGRDPDLVMDEIAHIVNPLEVASQGQRERTQSAQEELSSSALPTQRDAVLDNVRRRILTLLLARIEQQRPVESVEPQSDEPTADDQLGRRPFAQALVERMDKLYEKGGHDGFAAHIHAPWGAGKTSVLLMMRDLMIAADRKSDGKVAPRWVVVHFNAWQHERRNPPWWPLIEAIKNECINRLSDTKVGWFRVSKACVRSLWHVVAPTQNQDQAALLQARWIWWKIRTDALPYLVAAVVGIICLWLLWSIRGASNEKLPAIFEGILKLLTAAIAAYAAFSGASRVAVFGSSTAAKFYEDISEDPLKRITGLFKEIVDRTNRPICVFIDDLDRCRSDYVVDLLEGIQTSFRHKNVAYVVAADRSWIKASFEVRYGTFSNAVGNMGQSLGHLFLEKIFQVSTPVPGMGDATRIGYWNWLLKGARPRAKVLNADVTAGEIGVPLSVPSQARFDRAVENKRADLRERHGENLTRQQAEAVLQTNDTAEDRAAVVLELNTSRAAEREAEHLLTRFTGILPDNPRVMKRMVNAFAMRQAIGLLERSQTPTEVLARWTILEQRFPLLADLLIEHPEWMQKLDRKIDAKELEKLPPPLLPFLDSKVVREIIGVGDASSLTSEHVSAITRGSAG